EVNIPDDWQLTDITCTGGGSNTTTAGATATIGLDAGEAVVCTFTNTEEGSITIVKDAVNNDPQDFSYTTTGGLSPATFTLDDDGVGSNQQLFTGLLPGSYTVTEDPNPAGWQLTDLSCNDPDAGTTWDLGTRTATIDLDPGEDVVCTFENTEEGSITIVKDAVPDDPQDFGFSTTGLSPATFSLDDDGVGSNQRVFTDLLPGTYTVAEDADPSGWQLTDIACLGGGGNTSDTGRIATIGLDPGETVTCTFENTEEGSITIVKDAVPDDPQDFSYTTTGGLSPAAFSLDDDADGTLSNTRTFTGLLPGTYTVAEDADPAGWQLTDIACLGGGGDTSDAGRIATIGLDPGEDVTCTFENTKDGEIIVAKETLPDGSSQSFEFDPSYGPNFFLSDGGTNESGNLNPGTYSVAEVNIPSGWELTGSSCSDGSSPSAIGLSPGETVTCTFENTEEGSITIVKDALPDDPQDFGFSTTG
ncbi:MAG: prealbumin-like fold domain-containing protein, partial [Actinomycetota bacterium]